MFKPGEKALVVKTKEEVTVEEVVKEATEYCVIKTSGGPFHEDDLLPAHPTVLSTANPKDTLFVDEEEYEEDLLDEDDPEDGIDVLSNLTKVLKKNPKSKEAEKLLSFLDLGRKVGKALQEVDIELDLNGHWKNSPDVWFVERIKEDLRFMYLDNNTPVEQYEALLEAIENKTTLDTWVSLGTIPMGSHQCPYCCQRVRKTETNGKVIRFMGEPCPFPNGFELNEWEMNVPSGKIVVSNDLRRWFPLPKGESDIPSINTTLGCRQTSQAYADTGMSHGFVGNTCPSVYKLEQDTFKIANPPGEEYYDKKAGEWLPREEQEFEGEELAGICTDLWWYSLCDFEEFERRRERFGGELDEHWDKIIDVKPGVYLFQHDDEVDRDSGDEVVYATFKWIREPDPVRDFLKEFDDVDVNPHAYVRLKVVEWPSLYGTANILKDGDKGLAWDKMSEKQQLSAWQRVADQIFFTIGSGTDWHEKGFPTANVDQTIPDVDPPEFRRQFHWYPFSEGYGGMFSGVKLTPAFAKLGMRCLESVISFGSSVHDGDKCRDVDYVRQRMLRAVEKYRELMEKYPEQADPDYVWWLSQEGRAEAWVKKFDLGPKYTERHRTAVAKQRWVPEDAYAIEFDARKLDGNQHFAGKYGWAKKADAKKFAIEAWSDNEQEDPEDNCFWSTHAHNTAIPLYSVARVAAVGNVSHMGKTLVELLFDYGNDWMKDVSARKAVEESTHKAGIRILTKEEYEELLPKAEKFYSEHFPK